MPTPAMLAAPISHESTLARDVFGLDDETLAAIARAGVDASFMDTTQKAAPRRRDRLLAGARLSWTPAEGEGFEPSRGFDSPNPLSRRAH